MKRDGFPVAFTETYLPYLLARASHSVSSSFHASLKGWDLSVPEWRVLACLHDRKSATVTDLARLSLMEQSRLTHLIGRMQARGLVERQRSKTNRRSVEVTLSPDGATLARDLVAQAKAHERLAIHDRLGAEDTQVFHDLLRKLMADPQV